MGRPKKQPEKPQWYINKLARNVEYNKNNNTRFQLAFNNSTDADIIEFLNQQPNKQGFIKELIREHMKKTKEE